MTSGIAMALGIMVGVMVAAWFLSRKAMQKNYEYDEMQLKIRAKGYQIGFYTALFLLMIIVLLYELNYLTVVTPGFAAFAALILSVTVFTIYCILHDAFISIRGDSRTQIAVFSLVVLAEGLASIRYLTEGELFKNGVLTFDCGAPSLMFICFLAILITLIIKTVRNRKEAKE